MNDKYVSQLHSMASPHFAQIADAETFAEQMKDEESQKKFYRNMSYYYSLGSFKDFQTQVNGRSLLDEISLAPSAGYYQAMGRLASSGQVAESLMGFDIPVDLEAMQESYQSKYNAVAPTRNDPAAQFLRGGLESTISSVLTGAGGIAIGGAVGGFKGAIVGGVIGSGLLFGAAEYDSFLDDLGSQLEAQGMTKAQINAIKSDPDIKNAAMVSGLVEGGFETLSDLVLQKVFGLMGGGVKDAVGGYVNLTLGATVKRLAERYVKAASTEMTTEYIQSMTTTALRGQAGIETGMTPHEAGMSSLLPAAGASLFYGLGGEAIIRSTQQDRITGKIKRPVVPSKQARPYELGDMVVDGNGTSFEVLDISDPAQLQVKNMITGATQTLGRFSVLPETAGHLPVTPLMLETQLGKLETLSADQVKSVMTMVELMAKSTGRTLERFVNEAFVAVHIDDVGAVDGISSVNDLVIMDREKAETFYSGLRQNLNTIMPDNKMQVTAFKNRMNKVASKSAKKEAIWIGLDTWLDEKDGHVNKQEVLEFIRDNQVKVETDVWTSEDGDRNGTLHEHLVLPGQASDYRILTLTFPELPGQNRFLHFGSINNLAYHIRIDTRKLSDGSESLVVNEIQSDWSSLINEQEKQGYEPGPLDYHEQLQKLVDEYYVARKRLDEFGRNSFEGDMLPNEHHYRIQADNILYGLRTIYDPDKDIESQLFSEDKPSKDLERKFLETNSTNDESILHFYGKLLHKKAIVTDPKVQQYARLSDEKAVANRKISSYKQKFYNDMPITDTYLDTVVRQLIREAAEQNLGSISFPTTAQQVADIEGWGDWDELNSVRKERYKGIVKKLTVIAPRIASKFVKKYGGKVSTEKVDDQNITTITIPDALKEQALYVGQELFDKDQYRETGSTGFLKDGKAVLTMFQAGGDVQTLMHEIWHVFEGFLTKDQAAEFRSIFGYNPTDESPQQRIQMEIAARSFERYLASGKSPSRTLDTVYEDFRKWILDAKQSLDYQGVPVTADFDAKTMKFFDNIMLQGVAYDNGSPVPAPEISMYVEQARQIAEDHKKTFFSNSVDRVKDLNKRILGMFDVEVLWRNEGAGEVGRAAKAAPSISATYEEIGRAVYHVIGSMLKNDKNLEQSLIFGYEDEAVFDNYSNELKQQLKPIMEIYGKFFDNSKKELIKRGIIQDGFVENLKRDMLEKLAKALSGKRIDQNEVDQLTEDLEIVDKLKFEHIPLEWFSSYYTKDPSGGRRVLRYLNKKQRQNWTIKSLTETLEVNEEGVEVPIIRPEDVNLADIIMSYSRRLGRDISTDNIVKAALIADNKQAKYTGNPNGTRLNPKQRQAIIKKRQELIDKGWMSPPVRTPAFANYMVKPALFNWLEEQTQYQSKGTAFEKAMSWAKMAQFLNPVFLSTYNLVQHTMRFGLNPYSMIKHLRLSVKARNEFNLDPESKDKNSLAYKYRMLKMSAIASKPMSNSYHSYEKTTEEMRNNPDGKVFTEILNKLKEMKNPMNWMRVIYTTSWNLAWLGDETIRIASGLRLLDMDYSIHEAAQQAALFHGDYASVPAKTRRALNKVFFTPTFKIVMTKLYSRMVLGAFKTVTGTGRRESKAYAMGVVWSMALLSARHAVLLMSGWESDEFGRRYKRKVTTDKGQEELVWVFSDPSNIMLKYMYRTKESFTDGEEKPWLKMILKNKWELHPIWRTLYESFDNKKTDNSAIYSPFDNESVKFLKVTNNFIQNIVPLFKAPLAVVESYGETGSEVQNTTANEAYVNHVNHTILPKEILSALDVVTDKLAFKFSYVRGTQSERNYYKVRALRKKIRREMREGKLTEKKLQRFSAMINNILAEN